MVKITIRCGSTWLELEVSETGVAVQQHKLTDLLQPLPEKTEPKVTLYQITQLELACMKLGAESARELCEKYELIGWWIFTDGGRQPVSVPGREVLAKFPSEQVAAAIRESHIILDAREAHSRAAAEPLLPNATLGRNAVLVPVEAGTSEPYFDFGTAVAALRDELLLYEKRQSNCRCPKLHARALLEENLPPRHRVPLPPGKWEELLECGRREGFFEHDTNHVWSLEGLLHVRNVGDDPIPEGVAVVAAPTPKPPKKSDLEMVLEHLVTDEALTWPVDDFKALTKTALGVSRLSSRRFDEMFAAGGGAKHWHYSMVEGKMHVTRGEVPPFMPAGSEPKVVDGEPKVPPAGQSLEDRAADWELDYHDAVSGTGLSGEAIEHSLQYLRLSAGLTDEDLHTQPADKVVSYIAAMKAAVERMRGEEAAK